MGGISKCGDGKIRTMLFEVATRTTICSWLKAWGVKVAHRRGMKRAIIAVADSGILHLGSRLRLSRRSTASLRVRLGSER
jgi:hypothetical protein